MLQGGFQVAVIGQTAAHMRDLFLGKADLTDDASRVADGEDGDGMTFAAGAFGAACAMADRTLEEGAAKDVARLREPDEEAVAFLDCLLVIH